MTLLIDEKKEKKKQMKDLTLHEKFLKYHEDNPEIYEILKRLAFEAKKKGRKKIGIKMLWEVMRWERFIHSNDPEGYKLNNNYPSRYARLLMENEKELEGFFEVRKLRS